VFHVDQRQGFRPYDRHDLHCVSFCRGERGSNATSARRTLHQGIRPLGGPRGAQSPISRVRRSADDPFYNNIKGLVGAYTTASTAIKNGAQVDRAGCAHFDEATVQAIVDQMGHTDGGPAQNFLYNWTVSAIVISVDLSAISKGGKAARRMGYILRSR